MPEDGDIQKLVTRHGQDLYATADDIIAIYKALRAAYPQYRGLIYAVIDDTGVGGGVTDILNREKIRQKLTKLMELLQRRAGQGSRRALCRYRNVDVGSPTGYGHGRHPTYPERFNPDRTTYHP